MTKTKILITGGSGLLGNYLNIELSKAYEILTLYNSGEGNCKKYNSFKVDITNYNELEKVISGFKPGIVLHIAAISSPADSNTVSQKIIFETNVTATENIARLCDKYSSKLIYTSTDLVYDGKRGSMLKEDAKLNPISIYAETKHLGERKIQNTFENFIILRTALLYGIGLYNNKCFFNLMYNNFNQGKAVKLFYDQFRTPISLFDASRIIAHLCSKDVKGEIINFGGLERVSRLEFGEMLCKIAKFDNNLIIKTSMNDIPDFPAVEDVSMNTDKLQSFGIKQQNIEESIKEILNNKK